MDSENDEVTDTEESIEMTYTVSELNRDIKDVIKSNFDTRVSVIGEISNYKESYTHVYLTLKDTTSMINVVSWNHKRKFSSIQLKNGDKVTINGIITVFEKSGSYQLTAFDFKVSGVGDLYKKYMETKDQYEKKGYFNDSQKKSLSGYIRNIGIITASNGAALRDLLYVLKKNNYMGNVYIKNCIVQGNDCPNSVADCINKLDNKDFDAIIITRGGGSFEDLMGFSHYKAIEAIHNAKSCIISAIGHEVDFMLSDFVADIRSPTPSVAGEIITTYQKRQYNLDTLENVIKEIHFTITKKINVCERRISDVHTRLADPVEISKDCIKSFDNILDSVKLNIREKVVEYLYKQKELGNRFNTLDPNKVLENGFVLVSAINSSTKNDIDSNEVAIKSVKTLSKFEDKKLKLQFIDGDVILTIDNMYFNNE